MQCGTCNRGDVAWDALRRSTIGASLGSPTGHARATGDRDL